MCPACHGNMPSLSQIKQRAFLNDSEIRQTCRLRAKTLDRSFHHHPAPFAESCAFLRTPSPSTTTRTQPGCHVGIAFTSSEISAHPWTYLDPTASPLHRSTAALHRSIAPSLHRSIAPTAPTVLIAPMSRSGPLCGFLLACFVNLPDLFIRAYSCIFVHIRAYSCIFVHIRAYSCIFVHIRAYSCIFVHIRAYWASKHQ